ncbi:glycerophosphodiester phosphodiesterase family protein [Sphingomonas carotinifaciens]|uniref:glycerophosphodiester phosphodiesterase family protein n=1 Tax=Sphingomonas carotinifaciens TaxID=1166323 RepID=UPI0039A37F45
MAFALAAAAPASARERAASVDALFGDPTMPMLVVAHRACHNPAPRHGMANSVPENSLDGIARCIRLGVDVAEVDVRRSRDGYLVLMHDETVDRTTDGHGKVAELSLADIRKLHTRENKGGSDVPLTVRRVPLLDEALAAAKGRIVLNLDVQAGLYADTVAAVRRAKQENGVIIKQPAGMGSPVLADIPPFDGIPFMPILTGDGDLPDVAARQLNGIRRPVAFELPRMDAALLPTLATLARRSSVRLWANSLWEGFVGGMGGDVDALRDPRAVWGRMRAAGISIVQTDEPEALLAFLER